MQLLCTDSLKQLPAAILPKLIVMFSTSTPDLLTEIQQTAARGDLQAMAQAAHQLKGSCISLGAEKMADICTELQAKGEHNDAVGLNAYISELIRIYPATLAAMENV